MPEGAHIAERECYQGSWEGKYGLLSWAKERDGKFGRMQRAGEIRTYDETRLLKGGFVASLREKEKGTI